MLSDPFRGHDFKESSVIGGVIDYFAHAYGCRMINTEVTSDLRDNQPAVRVTSGQKLCTKIISYIVLQTSVRQRLFIIEVQKRHL